MRRLHKKIILKSPPRRCARKVFLPAAIFGCLWMGSAAGRSIYLNGVDISGATTQEMKGIDLHINEAGDVFITAPNYEVHEEDTYLPLSSYVKGGQAPAHKSPQSVAADQVKSMALDQLPSQPAAKAMEPAANSRPASLPSEAAVDGGGRGGLNPELPAAVGEESAGFSPAGDGPPAASNAALPLAKSGRKSP